MTTETQLYTAEELAKDETWCSDHYAIVDGGYAAYTEVRLTKFGKIALKDIHGHTRRVPPEQPMWLRKRPKRREQPIIF